ncbi:dienelactone hydrolase family protein [Candidatus Nitrospira bockiana]
MAERQPPFSLQQIGTGAFRFPSGAPVPSLSDAAVDPYYRTRTPKEALVETIVFWPQEKGLYPGVVLLHERWGLNAQIKDVANRLACEGMTVIVPNLYGRQGGMVTAHAETADTLAARIKESEVLQDINSCCEFLNSRDQVKKNLHAVVGFGLGGSLAIRFACQRKRLRAAVAYYGRVTAPAATLKDLVCPVLYHRAGDDPLVTEDELDRLRQAGKESGKPVEIKVYEGAPHGFADTMRTDTYRPDAERAAWDATVAFLNERFQAER